MTEFDLYCTHDASPPQVGARLLMDGVDGFFDQYFEARKPGDAIRFLMYPFGPGPVGVLARQIAELPLVSATIREADEVSGTVEVTDVSSLDAWLRELAVQPALLAGEVADRTKAPVADLLAEASRSGAAVWFSNMKRWTRPVKASAVYAVQLSGRVRVAVLATNAVPGWVADVVANAG